MVFHTLQVKQYSPIYCRQFWRLALIGMLAGMLRAISTCPILPFRPALFNAGSWQAGVEPAPYNHVLRENNRVTTQAISAYLLLYAIATPSKPY